MLKEPKTRVVFDEKTEEFLDSLEKESTIDIYRAGLTVFQAFYTPQGTIKDFLDRVDQDLLLPRGKRARVATNTLRALIRYMKEPEDNPRFSANTINTYVSSVRSLVSYLYDYEYKIPVKGIGLPNAEAESDKTPWTLELISKFAASMDKLMYKAIVAVIFQSGQGLEEILSLTYGDIQEEFEKNVRPLRLELKRKKTEKTGVKYETFLGNVALDLLKAYFKERGTPKPEEKIFPITKESVERYFARRARKFIELPRGNGISGHLKPWKGSCPMRPHTLRAAFDKLLIRARCPEIFAEYWMGHEVEKNKDAYIIKDMGPEEWREEYRNSEPALTFKV